MVGFRCAGGSLAASPTRALGAALSGGEWKERLELCYWGSRLGLEKQFPPESGWCHPLISHRWFSPSFLWCPVTLLLKCLQVPCTFWPPYSLGMISTLPACHLHLSGGGGKGLNMGWSFEGAWGVSWVPNTVVAWDSMVCTIGIKAIVL